MGPWMWFAAVFVVGCLLLVGAALLDRRARRRVTGAGQPAPLRSNEAVDSHVPSYITQDEIDALPLPGRGHHGTAPHAGEGFSFGHATPDFATLAEGAAAWHDPVVLIVDGAVGSMRELLAPVARATPGAPLMIVADDFHDDVLATLGANRRVLHAPIVAARAGARDRRRLAELTGATAVTPTDLQAGYVPEQALGHAAHWASAATRCWVDPLD